MPTGSLPKEGKALWEKVYQRAKKGSCKGDEECAARTAWSAVKGAGWKKDKEGNWYKASKAEFSLTIVKAALILVDTSVWVSVLRDKTGDIVAAFRKRVGSEVTVLSRFNQLELLQGAKNVREWQMLEEYLATQIYLEASSGTWREAARIYFDLRREVITVSSAVDCCIAQVALESGALLLHCDHDFERVAKVRKVEEEFFAWE